MPTKKKATSRRELIEPTGAHHQLYAAFRVEAVGRQRAPKSLVTQARMFREEPLNRAERTPDRRVPSVLRQSSPEKTELRCHTSSQLGQLLRELREA